MIIILTLEVIYLTFYALLLPVWVPSFPDGAMEYINQLFDYVTAGAGILANYIPLSYVMLLFSIILTIDVVVKLYHLVMWVLKKIPMAGIS